jgi:hypothetical protein
MSPPRNEASSGHWQPWERPRAARAAAVTKGRIPLLGLNSALSSTPMIGVLLGMISVAATAQDQGCRAPIIVEQACTDTKPQKLMDTNHHEVDGAFATTPVQRSAPIGSIDARVYVGEKFTALAEIAQLWNKGGHHRNRGEGEGEGGHGACILCLNP